MGEADAVQPGAGPEQAAAAPRNLRAFYLLCLPTLLGSVAFAFSFPIDRHVPFLRSVSIAEVYGVWWLMVAPACTLVTYIQLMRNTWKRRWSGKTLALAWTTMMITGALSLFLALAMIAASY